MRPSTVPRHTAPNKRTQWAIRYRLSKCSRYSDHRWRNLYFDCRVASNIGVATGPKDPEAATAATAERHKPAEAAGAAEAAEAATAVTVERHKPAEAEGAAEAANVATAERHKPAEAATVERHKPPEAATVATAEPWRSPT